MHVRNDPRIFTGCSVRIGKSKGKSNGKVTEAPSPEEGDKKGELLIRGMCTQGKDSNHDIRVVNTETASYQSKTQEKCIESSERKKKKNYHNNFLNKRRHFNPFFASGGGLLGVKVEATLK